MSERFRRFDPSTMNPEDYVGNSYSRHYDLRTGSVLTTVFSELSAAFAEKAAQIAHQSIGDIPLSGGAVIQRNYNSQTLASEVTEFIPGLRLLRTPTCMYSHQTGGRPSLDIYIPIGDYGNVVAAAHVNTTRALYTVIKNSMAGTAMELDRKYSSVIEVETYQKNSYYSLHEGIQSVAAAFSVLSTQHVEGYENDPLGLYQALVREDIINFFAANMAIGRIFPMAKRGLYIQEPIVNDAGKLRVRDEVREAVIADRHEAEKASKAGERGKGCPVAKKTIEHMSPDGVSVKASGVNLIADVYLRYLTQFLQRENPWIVASEEDEDKQLMMNDIYYPSAEVSLGYEAISSSD